jgi:hypothetical protein
MKKIEAIIRKTKFDEVKEALNKAGIEFLYSGSDGLVLILIRSLLLQELPMLRQSL